MTHDSDPSKRLAQNLVELLAPYEEELINLEISAPGVAALRRAVGIVIAEACYCISDKVTLEEEWAPSTDGQASPSK
jgi:hypothetical protein